MRRILTTILSITSFIITAGAQEPILRQIEAQRLTSENGLPSDIVHCIVQDKKGFLWIGTNDGLCKFDGHRFTTYRHDPADSQSISFNDVISIMADSKGNIWAGTSFRGLNKFEPATQKFIHYKNEKNKKLFEANSIFSVQEVGNDSLAIAQSLLYVLDVKSGKATPISMPENTWSDRTESKIPRKYAPYRVFIDNNKKWWLAGESGSIVYDPAGDKMNLFSLRKDISPDFRNSSTWNTAEDIHGNIWIANGVGLFEYNRVTDKVTRHYPDRFDPADCKSPWVKNLLCSQDGTIWFGTNNGLFHYAPTTGQYVVGRNNPRHSRSLSGNDIQYLYEDRQRVVWVCTDNGLNAIYPVISPFIVEQSNPDNKLSLQSNTVKASFKDEEGNMWVGTGVGLECIDAKTKKTSIYRYIDPGLATRYDYTVMPILRHDDNTLWIGTWGCGMQLFDYRKRKFIKSYTHQAEYPETICSNFIHSLCKDEQGNLWIATWNGGIDKLDLRTGKFEHFNTGNRKSGIRHDYINKISFAGGIIRASCMYGVYQYDKLANRFRLYHLDADTNDVVKNSVNDIVEDSNGTIWMGTWQGLWKWNTKSNRPERDNLFPGHAINSLLVDHHNNLWLATLKGLVKYNTSKKSWITYTMKDGLPIGYFPVECYFSESPDHEITVSSTNGLIRFYPDKFSRPNPVVPLYISSIKIENKEAVGLGDISSLKEIKLKHDENYLTIEFAALNFINANQNQYSYKLEGFDDDWINAGNRNQAIYTNLPPGQYSFHVRSSVMGSDWNESSHVLNISIQRPWWRTWWAYSLAMLFLVSLIYGIYKIRINRILAEQKLRNKIARDLHDDIGSTLSGIKLFSGMAKQKLTEEKSEALGIISRIGERSETMIDAMSDIVWSINPKNDSIENMLVRMKEYAAEMLENKQIAYDFVIDEKINKLRIGLESRRDVYLIFKESINNVVKHSECHRVVIELKTRSGFLLLSITDDGKGIDKQILNGRGNGLVNIRERANRIKAEVEINSDLQKGTTIYVKIPLT